MNTVGIVLASAAGPTLVGLAAAYAPSYGNRQLARRLETREHRRARRLVAHELNLTAVLLIALADGGVAHNRSEVERWLSSIGQVWADHKDVLASALREDDDWKTTAAVVPQISLALGRVVAGGPAPEVAADERQTLGELGLRVIEVARGLENASIVRD